MADNLTGCKHDPPKIYRNNNKKIFKAGKHQSQNQNQKRHQKQRTEKRKPEPRPRATGSPEPEEAPEHPKNRTFIYNGNHK